jgi:hypothetical protein
VLRRERLSQELGWPIQCHQALVGHGGFHTKHPLFQQAAR